MTTKSEVELNAYQKRPRILAKSMENELRHGGMLKPIMDSLGINHQLRLDIRDMRFNIYYEGGNLMLVDGRKSPYELRFDSKYFKGGNLLPKVLPTQALDISDIEEWVQAFPDLIAGMESWWKRHPKEERAHCHAMAISNAGIAGSALSDYIILDLEYQWAQRRFDLIAAKRQLKEDDICGWSEPDFVFVEVKSNYDSCTGKSGLVDHVNDYIDIISANNGRSAKKIKSEYEEVIAQKIRLNLIDRALGFQCFSKRVPELLIVFVDLDPNARQMQAPLAEIKVKIVGQGNAGCIRYMWLNSPDYSMTVGRTI